MVKNMQDFFTLISNFGFPVVVAGYLLFRFEKKLEQLEQTNDDLVTEIRGLERQIGELHRAVKRKDK